ncbi:response regulator transcription factor [bacterium]|nr:response regulator transcription factor [bacterium]
MAIRILIADDHRILRAGLKSMLNADANLEVIGEATNGEEALQAAQKLRPNIVLMDIGMPGNEGLEATRQLVQLVPEARVLMLTMHEDSALVQECLRAGASGYIIKRAAESELIDAIYAVSRGIIYVHPSLMRSLVTPPSKTNGHISAANEPLTLREVEILKLIVKGYTNHQIADTLTISVRTVETHRANLMSKLDLHSRVDLVRYASEHKLIKTE